MGEGPSYSRTNGVMNQASFPLSSIAGTSTLRVP
ncbi:hypothetical protein LINPERPRIM_LOCUS33745 [Linum perenne]